MSEEEDDVIDSSSIPHSTTDHESVAPSIASSSLPLAPNHSFYGSRGGPPSPSSPSRRTNRIIQVDDVLTGGFAMDASTKETSHSQDTPHICNQETVRSPTPEIPPPSSPSSSKAGNCVKSLTTTPSTDTSQANKSQPHGYLLQTALQSTPIAELIPAPPLLCQAGLFYYRVTSSHPLVILTGPCADAPRTKGWVLPGTVHEISLRMGTCPDGMGGSGINGSRSMSLEDGIVYLRLSHRKGWIADRQYALSSATTNRGEIRHHPTKSGTGKQQRVEIVMKEVSESIDLSAFHIRDDISLGGTSISSASVSTPASVIRTRRRPRRRRLEEDIGVTTTRDGMPHNSKTSINRAIHSVPEAVTSPVSDVSLLSGMSSKVNHGVGSAGKGKSECSFPASNTNTPVREDNSEQVRHSRPSRYLIRVTAPNGLKILDAPSFQVNSLIRGQNGPSMLPFTRKSVAAPTDSIGTQSVGTIRKQPSSIFHTMSGSLRHQESPKRTSEARSWTFDASGKTRILPRGVLFEASKRMERAEHYTPGSGLIKLADKTGWAIIPTKDELISQYKMYQGAGIDYESTQAYEEVGNAFTPEDCYEKPLEYKWIRITQRTGVIVSCTPYNLTRVRPNVNLPVVSQGIRSQPDLSSVLNSKVEKDTDTASTVSSVFLDAFRSTRKQEAKLESLVAVGHKGQPIESRATIACGICVEVEPWQQTKSPEQQVISSVQTTLQSLMLSEF